MIVTIQNFPRRDNSFIKKDKFIMATDKKNPDVKTLVKVVTVSHTNFMGLVLYTNDEEYKKEMYCTMMLGSTCLEYELFNGSITIEQ